MTAESDSIANKRFFDQLWSGARFVTPDRFNTWPLATELSARAARRLEVGPGLRPRLPIPGTHFLDLSGPAVEALRERGGLATLGEAYRLPYEDASFDLVCAFDVMEHVEDDGRVMAELSRVLDDGGVLILSAPLHADRWTSFDTMVGHCHRYDPEDLIALLASGGFTIERSAPYGMQPRSALILDFGVHVMRTHPSVAMNWYNRILMPLALRFEKRLRLSEGLIDTRRVDEALLVCRRARRVRSTGASSSTDQGSERAPAGVNSAASSVFGS